MPDGRNVRHAPVEVRVYLDGLHLRGWRHVGLHAGLRRRRVRRRDTVTSRFLARARKAEPRQIFATPMSGP